MIISQSVQELVGDYVTQPQLLANHSGRYVFTMMMMMMTMMMIMVVMVIEMVVVVVVVIVVVMAIEMVLLMIRETLPPV